MSGRGVTSARRFAEVHDGPEEPALPIAGGGLTSAMPSVGRDHGGVRVVAFALWMMSAVNGDSTLATAVKIGSSSSSARSGDDRIGGGAM
jgi:hypothetical protein